jgi:hypothetical protein
MQKRHDSEASSMSMACPSVQSRPARTAMTSLNCCHSPMRLRPFALCGGPLQKPRVIYADSRLRTEQSF